MHKVWELDHFSPRIFAVFGDIVTIRYFLPVNGPDFAETSPAEPGNGLANPLFWIGIIEQVGGLGQGGDRLVNFALAVTQGQQGHFQIVQ
jgi:hypothetical protein